ncbi:hypothetical protein niasHT_020470 [Heterodera trifolii]|uniref:Effector protein n=1 Tax=Heterodera trifolii TaxID=157864 RepID=A0ABD2JGD9_9BILA
MTIFADLASALEPDQTLPHSRSKNDTKIGQMFANKLFLFLIAAFALCVFGIDFGGTKQNGAAKGKLLCGGKPYKGAKVKLWDKDTLDPDDLMGETETDEEGKFEVNGSETEVSDIDLRLSIYHNCEDEAKECLRRIDIEIGDEFISRLTDADKAEKVFDAGILNLSGHFPGETRECLQSKK